MNHPNRREFLQQSAIAAGSLLLLPVMSSCVADPREVPSAKPLNWDPILFNKKRGNAGAIPESYLKDINGPDGKTQHIGKHLPYIPKLDPAQIPQGYIALMWGDPSKGYTPHPNAPADPSANYIGHWYNWIRIRKASKWWAETVESVYSGWPSAGASDTGKYTVFGAGEITADKGIHTVYLAKLPLEVKSGDTIRIWAHCLTHGEYVDFITI